MLRSGADLVTVAQVLGHASVNTTAIYTKPDGKTMMEAAERKCRLARISKAKQLTDRDKNILTDLARCRALSMNRIKNAYWPDAKERTCLERLERLKKPALSESGLFPVKKLVIIRIYHLEEKGKRWATGQECDTGQKKVLQTPANQTRSCTRSGLTKFITG